MSVSVILETENLTSTDRLGLALLIAVLVHAILILGISFTIDKPEPTRVDKSLEIILSRSPVSEKQPAEAEFLSDASRQASGAYEEETRPIPIPQLPAPQQELLLPMEPVQAPEPVVEKDPPPGPETLTLTQKNAPPKPTKKEEPKTAAEEPPQPPTAADLLASTNLEIERLTLELARKEQAYAGRPRHKAVSASTQEYKYANYLYAWKKKVEAIGNLNYPEEAKRRKLYGNLVMTVVVRADGTIDGIRIIKSSGYKLLDDAAVRIVKLAAPFAPFPPDIRAEADMLDITRTWQFLSGDKLRSK